MAEPAIHVEVVHAGVERCWRCHVTLPAGSTAKQAVDATGLLAQVSPADREPLRLGIHSHRVEVDHVLCDGDRVEIYRPLQLDPMAARRHRAEKGR